MPIWYQYRYMLVYREQIIKVGNAHQTNCNSKKIIQSESRKIIDRKFISTFNAIAAYPNRISQVFRNSSVIDTSFINKRENNFVSAAKWSMHSTLAHNCTSNIWVEYSYSLKGPLSRAGKSRKKMKREEVRKSIKRNWKFTDFAFDQYYRYIIVWPVYRVTEFYLQH